MKRFVLSTLIIALLAFAVGCSAPSRAAPTAAPQMDVIPAQGGAAEAPGRAVPKAPPAPGDSSTNNYQAQDEQRLIVYTGALSLQVNDTADTINKIGDILKNVNGYISGKSVVAYGKDKLRGTINVRIPAVALDPTLAQIKALGLKVLKETQDSNDVTSEYVDLDARRKNLEAYEVELTKLLDTVRERTGKAEDILAVYNQLTEVRGQIEQIKGRQKYLENTSALATYSIELVPVEEVVVEGEPGWNPGQVFAESLDALVGALQTLAEIAIRFVVLVLPILLILFLPVVIFILIVRWFVKRRGAKKAAPAN